MNGVLKQLKGTLQSNCRAISLIKGFEETTGALDLISDRIKNTLNVDCCTLMGANLANEVALEQFSEATIGYDEVEAARCWKALIERPYFPCSLVGDRRGVELCGGLKNVIALAAGMVDGLGMGDNTRAAIIRRGLLEIKALALLMHPGMLEQCWWESCGIADLITTCLGGRNRLVAMQYTRSYPHRTMAELEAELLRGQKLQGPSACQQAMHYIVAHDKLNEFPLIRTIHRIIFQGLPPNHILLDI